MSKERRGESGFTLIELLVVVAILGILAAIIIPNVGRFLGSGTSESQDSEFQTIVTAVSSMMVDNGLTSIPNPVSAVGTGCTNFGTKDMALFPDSTSVGGSADKSSDPTGTAYDATDKAGFLLYTHDIVGGGSSVSTTTVNYLATDTSAFCYTVASDGTVTQYDTDGNQTNP